MSAPTSLLLFSSLLLFYYQVQRNPLMRPPLEVALRGVEAVIDYLDTVKAFGAVESYRGRIVVLGHAMSGKTSVQQSLREGW